MLDQTLYWTITANSNDLLLIRWKDTASNMPEQEFKQHLLRLVELLRTSGIKKFLVDASLGHFIMLPHIQEWHDCTIVPQYEAMGVKKIAFVYPKDVVEAMSLDQTFDEQRAKSLYTRFFGSIDKALDWIGR
ncbi:hypothetical protein [Rhodoflexus sp.]